MEKLTKAQQTDVDSICKVLGIEILDPDEVQSEQDKNIDEIMSLIK